MSTKLLLPAQKADLERTAAMLFPDVLMRSRLNWSSTRYKSDATGESKRTHGERVLSNGSND
ncbi:MAG: hypothetical protein AAF664_26295 [Planctomycetota bacterium]